LTWYLSLFAQILLCNIAFYAIYLNRKERNVRVMIMVAFKQKLIYYILKIRGLKAETTQNEGLNI